MPAHSRRPDPRVNVNENVSDEAAHPHTAAAAAAADRTRDLSQQRRRQESESESVFGPEPRNHTGNTRLKSARLQREHDALMAPTRDVNGSLEATPITSSAATPPVRDYASISPSHSRDPIRPAPAPSTQHPTTTAPEEGTAGVVARGAPQKRSGSAERLAEATERGERGGWGAFWEKWGSVELENKGSVARDHLALERTFLAWLRTSLSFASIGIAITQLFRLNSSLRPDTSPTSPQSPSSHTNLHTLRHLGKPLGATFIGISILLLLLGFHRYFEAQHYVIRGRFPASRGSIVVVSVVAGGLIVSSLVVVLAVGEGGWES